MVVAAHPDEVYGTLGQHNDWCALHGKTVAEVKASVPSDVDIRWSVAGGARGVRDDALVLQLTEVGPGQLVGLMSTDQLDPVPCR